MFIILLTLLKGFCLYGQSHHSLIEYTTENGLSLNSVNDLHFDKQGFLWITTADGLQRFDGYRFQTFKHDVSDKKSIPDNSVSAVYEDNEGNLWISHRSGICLKPKGKNDFMDLTSAVLGNLPYRNPFICVYETDSVVRLMNFPDGIYTVNKYNLRVQKTFSFNETTGEVPLLSLSRVRISEDRFWFRKGADKSGDIYTINKGGIQRYSNIEKAAIHFIIPSGTDTLVMVTDKMLFKALSSDPFRPVKILKQDFDAGDFQNNIVTLPLKIANNQYLLPGNDKIWLYDGNTETITLFPHAEYFPGELIRYLNTTTADRHQNSWLGYNGIGGIKVISPQKFNLFNRPEKNALTYTLTADYEGNIYAGIYLGDIEVYDKEGRFLKKIKLPEAHKKFGSPRGMAMINSETLIVKSTLHELYAVDIKNGAIQMLSHLLPRQDSSFRVFELGIQQTGNGEVWFSYSNRIFSLQKNKSGYSCKTVITLPEKELITCLLFTNEKKIWMGTVSGVWDYENNIFKKIPLPATYVKHINQHPDGSIWVATTFGLYVLKNNTEIKHLNIKDGLPNSFVYSILFDKSGNGWVSTNRGLAKITPVVTGKDTSYTITSYSAREGLQGDEFNTKGYYKTPDGTLYFAGVNGINYFKPESLVSKGWASQTMLTEIEVNNQPYKPELQTEFIQMIHLPHRENNIRLSFSCMDFTVPEKNQYKFWLKNFQNNWSLPQTNNTVQYILPPGEYELYVLGANYEGVWAKEPLVLKIHILPPWYQTTWARFIFSLIVLSIVAVVFFFISRSRYRKKLQKLQMEQEVQKEKQRLSRDLHDNLGSQLTWLSNNISQLERAQQEQKPIEQKLESLKEGAGELMQTLRETIWIMNKEKVSAVEFFDKLVNHAARHIEAYAPLQLQTEENISVNYQLNSGTALQLFRICQEAITNACKHAQASLLDIKAEADEKYFSITISDNGKGFDLNTENSGHYGLQNMKERAKESNLELKIGSVADRGTSITVKA